MKYIITVVLVSLCVSASFGQELKTYRFKPQVENFALNPSADLSLNHFNANDGIPAAILIFGGIGIGAVGAGTNQFLLLGLGAGLTTTGLVLAFSNIQSNRWE